MSRRKRLFQKKIQQAKRVGKDPTIIVPKGMKNPKLLALVSKS